MDNGETCSTREAAAMLGISVRGAQLWVEQGKLDAWKTPGGHRRIFRRSVMEILRRRQPDSRILSEQFNVLVVEDDAIERLFVERLLRNIDADIDVRSASGGFDGLICMGERPPHILVTDLVMPGIDGFEMLAALQSSPLVSPMQIIVMTALEGDEIRARGGLPGGVTLLHKPVPVAKMTKLVRAYYDIWMVQEGKAS